jgi:dipeptidyl aminopeptidase/acylaminoacyl peptidase
MTKLGNPEYWFGASVPGEVAQFSPDHHKFIVVLRKGNLQTNTNEFPVFFWQTDQLFRSPAAAPKFLFAMASSSNRPAIRDVRWLADNETIEFIGENPEETAQLYTFNITNRLLSKVSAADSNIVGFSSTPDGKQHAYIVEEEPRRLWDETNRRLGIHVTTQELSALLVGRGGENPERRLFIQRGSEKPHLLNSGDPIGHGVGSIYPHLSPDGRYVIVLTNTAQPPDVWRGYEDPMIQRLMSKKKVPGQTTWFSRYELIDTITGKSRPLWNVPYHTTHKDLLWASDSRSVVIAGTYLPLEGGGDPAMTKKASRHFTVEVQVPTGQITVITEEELTLLGWDPETDQLICQSGERFLRTKRSMERRFQKRSQTWTEVKRVSFGARNPTITLEEDLNTPPKIYAVSQGGEHRALLLDLNPQFAQLKFGAVKEIAWKGPDDVEINGGLYYPVNYVPGHRYPLVIQTHNWTSEKFWIDGPWTTAYAAQALAGKGIMVLQAEKWNAEHYWLSALKGTPREVEAEVTVYERALDQLDSMGLIDREHVGIMGFSRTCLYVKRALTSSRYKFAAASVTDGIDAGYMQYLVTSNALPQLRDLYERLNGGNPFGDALHNWLERSPEFNLGKVHTPVLITALNPSSILFEWAWFAGLSNLEKPVDMMLIQDGEHILQKPSDRIISQQATVDWFAFWLKGEEDPDSTKAGQYSLWHHLRELQEQDQAKVRNDSVSPSN